MPLYEYKCEDGCGNFDAWKTISERDQASHCPICDKSARRIFSPPMLLSGSLRLKQENLEPTIVQRTTPPPQPQLKSHAGRPWMVTH
jgi:putative FmdB family regulatory protein